MDLSCQKINQYLELDLQQYPKNSVKNNIRRKLYLVEEGLSTVLDIHDCQTLVSEDVVALNVITGPIRAAVANSSKELLVANTWPAGI